MFHAFHANLIHAPLPGGGGRHHAPANLQAALKTKKSIIQIPKHADNLCCARAIVTAKAKLDGHQQWNSIRQGCKIQRDLAVKLQRMAGIPIGTQCGPDEWKKFQDVIGPTYQLVVISRAFFNTVVFKGEVFSNNQLYLYHADHHFSVITSMPAFLNRVYYCKQCNVGYQNPGGHTCKDGCTLCKASIKCGFQRWIPCSTCHRCFVSNSCYNRHLEDGICATVKACPSCGQQYHAYRKHVCGMVYCNVCKAQQPQDHECYMQPLKEAEERKKKQMYIFYDFECLLDDEEKHVPNLCVVNKVCEDCMKTPIEQTNMCDCGREQLVFKGEDTLTLFGDWLFSGKNRKAICIAHNAQVCLFYTLCFMTLVYLLYFIIVLQGYDLHLMMDYVHSHAIKPVIIQNGRKILCLEANTLKLIDSLCYLPFALCKLPSLFGLTELEKG